MRDKGAIDLVVHVPRMVMRWVYRNLPVEVSGRRQSLHLRSVGFDTLRLTGKK